MIDEDDEGGGECPYCASRGNCEHLLLLADLTFRTAEGGGLFDAFRDRWGVICDQEDGDFDEADAFDELLDEVDGLADASSEYVHEGGPGMTSKYAVYWCSTADGLAQALQNFETENANEIPVDGDRCPFCQVINTPAANEVCRHHVGWQWDSWLELEPDAEKLRETWEIASEYLQTRHAAADLDTLIAKLAGQVPLGQRLIEKASLEADFKELLEVLGVQNGGGWHTGGMLGGSGYNLYSEDSQAICDAAEFYERLCRNS